MDQARAWSRSGVELMEGFGSEFLGQLGMVICCTFLVGKQVHQDLGTEATLCVVAIMVCLTIFYLSFDFDDHYQRLAYKLVDFLEHRSKFQDSLSKDELLDEEISKISNYVNVLNEPAGDESEVLNMMERGERPSGDEISPSARVGHDDDPIDQDDDANVLE